MKLVIYGLLALLGLEFNVLAATKINIPVVTAKKIDLSENVETLIYPAKVESKVFSILLAESDGVVQNILNIGTPVKTGQSLMKIRNSDPVYQYAPVQVRSPVKGIISEVFVTDGAQVVRGEKLATVIDPTQTRIVVEIPNSDLTKIKSGQKGTFQFSPATTEDQKIHVEVLGISPLVNGLTGTASAVLNISDKNTLRAGTLGKVEFQLMSGKQILVDENSIVYRNSQPFVRIIENDISKYREVTLGARQAGKVVIIKGLRIGEWIVGKSSQYIPDNKKIKIEKE
jgi:multidrug efflux pump subunit AcrA (membrane-fusion protein)